MGLLRLIGDARASDGDSDEDTRRSRPWGNEDSRREEAGGGDTGHSRDAGGFQPDPIDEQDEDDMMMQPNPADEDWRYQLHAEDPVDAQNVFGNWCPAMIRQILQGEAQVHFLNMNASWMRWLPIDSGQLAAPATKTKQDSIPIRVAQPVEVRRGQSDRWKQGIVVRTKSQEILVRYAGLNRHHDEWITFNPSTVAPLGEHLQARNLSLHRQLSATTPSIAHDRVIQETNPRFRHYEEALGSRGLSIFHVQGDGNCLFRAVSHQVYGRDSCHGVTRACCMDYMESEKEYFEPYVVGDMTAFLQYVGRKRRNGVWGDDPEIQAMCELYDRPAEVYAYDPVDGVRKLRSFHENGARERNRPPIRLSYYGGGHYDSVVGPDHARNCLDEAPGQVERRRIAYVHRRNAREVDDTMGVAQQVQDESDRASTEDAQLEHILMLSRKEFDAMNSNLEDTLHDTLARSSSASGSSEYAQAAFESDVQSTQEDLIASAKKASEEEQLNKAMEASLGSYADQDMHAAIQASLEDRRDDSSADEMERVMQLSAQEYAYSGMSRDDATNADELDELQRAIQASLQQ